MNTQTEEQTLAIVPAGSGPNIETLEPVGTPVVWDGFKSRAATLLAGATSLVVTDVSQVALMKEARVKRLTLRSLRIEVENHRVERGEYFKTKKQEIDGQAAALKNLLAPVEAHLLLQEQFAERAEAIRVEELLENRIAEITHAGGNPKLYSLRDMAEADFVELTNGLRATQQIKINAAKSTEIARQEADKAAALERERVQAENARLKAEAAVREQEAATERESARLERIKLEDESRARQAAAEAIRQKQEDDARAARAEIEAAQEVERARLRSEREAAEETARQERAARKVIEDAERARKAAEQAEIDAAAEAARRAAAAPDKEKLLALASAVRGILVGEMVSPEGIELYREIYQHLEKTAGMIERRANAL